MKAYPVRERRLSRSTYHWPHTCHSQPTYSTHTLQPTWLQTMQAMHISMHTHTSQSLLNAINPIYEKSNGFASNGSTHLSTLLIYLINESSKQRAITQASSTYFIHKR